MAFYNLIGRPRCSAVSRKTACKMFLSYCFIFSAYLSFFVKVLIETNISTVNISNELNFSGFHRSVNYIWVASKVSGTPSVFIPNVVYT